MLMQTIRRSLFVFMIIFQFSILNFQFYCYLENMIFSLLNMRVSPQTPRSM